MRAQNGKKRRGFTIRDSNERTTPAQKQQRLAEHQTSKAQIGDRKSGLVKDRLISRIGPGKYGELLKQLDAVTVKDS
jgi:hypothetical protein